MHKRNHSLIQKAQKKGESDFKARALTAIIFVIVVIALISISKYTLAALFTLISIGCGYEYLKLFLKKPGLAIVLSVLLTCGFIYLSTFKSDHSDFFLAVFTLVFMLYSIMALYAKKALIIHRYMPLAMSLGIIITPIYLLGNHIFTTDTNGSIIILFIFLIIWSADSFAYLVGRKIGKRKLFPSVSPNKSWEGFLGSGLITLSLGMLVGNYLLPGINLLAITALVLSAWLFGGIGDLVQSSIKRYADIKDSGNLFPGHGGMWDRFDSFIFMCPLAFLILKYLA